MKKDKLLKIVIFVVVLLIPIIYSFFYLKSYWDPYADLTGLKIAIVNLDEGENGKNQGEEFLNELKNSGTFDICDTTLTEANDGMRDGKYYALITIPSDFTSCLNSASSKEKQISTITYSPNQASNYLSSQIINSGIKTIETNLRASINSQIAETLADNLKEVPVSLLKISDGAKVILEGSQTLNSGLKQISDGTSTLNENYAKFNDGVNSAYDGSKKIEEGLTSVGDGVDTLSNGSESLNSAIALINNGVNELSNQGSEGITKLSNGISTIAAGTSNLNESVLSYVDNVDTLAQKSSSYVQSTADIMNDVNSYISDATSANKDAYELLLKLSNADTTNAEKMQELTSQAKNIIANNSQENLATKANNIITKEAYLSTSGEVVYRATKIQEAGTLVKGGVQKLDDGVKEFATSASSLTNLTSGITEIKNAMEKVSKGSSSLNYGILSIREGVIALQNGSGSLTDGLSTLNTSSLTIKDAISTLDNGVSSAYDGSTKLVNGLEEFDTQIQEGLNDTNEQLEALDGIEEFAKNPVEFKTQAYGTVDSYGVAFTPLFLCIGLWVGALMAYVVLFYDQKHRFGIFDSKNSNNFMQNLAYILIGVAQGVIVGFLLKVGLGFKVDNLLLYYFASILIGITFMSIIQFFIKNFGDVGKFLALVVLVLQLAASGGTFPIETINKGFQLVTPYLPMTYSIKLLREILVPTATNFKGNYILILTGITVFCLVVTYIIDVIKAKKQKA